MGDVDVRASSCINSDGGRTESEFCMGATLQNSAQLAQVGSNLLKSRCCKSRNIRDAESRYDLGTTEIMSSEGVKSPPEGKFDKPECNADSGLSIALGASDSDGLKFRASESEGLHWARRDS